jgi:hypothetical protein
MKLALCAKSAAGACTDSIYSIYGEMVRACVAAMRLQGQRSAGWCWGQRQAEPCALCSDGGGL